MIKINDALTLSAIIAELRETLVGQRITKIVMPDRNTLILVLHKQNLVFRTGNGAAAFLTYNVQRITYNGNNQFQQRLQRLLGGGIVEDVFQPPYERVCGIRITAEDDFKDKRAFFLYAELMGKYSNIILTDFDNKIIACLNQITDYRQAADNGAGNDTRVLVSGAQYGYPQGAASEEYIKSVLNAELGRGDCVWDDRLKIDKRRFIQAFADKNHPNPPVKACPFSGVISVNGAADIYYNLKTETDDINGRKQQLAAAVESVLKANKKQAAAAQETLNACAGFETDKLYGDIITNNIYKIKSGTVSVLLNNYLENREIEIPLDTKLSPQGNAAKYYKSYAKKQKQYEDAVKAKEQAELTIAKAEDCLSLIRAADDGDFESASEQITAAGLIHAKPAKTQEKTQSKLIKPNLEIEGFKIYVGKTDEQNEGITFKLGRKNDVWLHALGVSGSHVLIQAQNKPVPMPVILKAAAAAAYASKAKTEDTAAVDYTFIQYVKKQKGGRPGQVAYIAQKTVFVKPERII